jgi:hypothetical protein
MAFTADLVQMARKSGLQPDSHGFVDALLVARSHVPPMLDLNQMEPSWPNRAF